MTDAKPNSPPHTSRLLDLYERMVLVRVCEESLGTLFADGEIPGFIHLSIGQEAVSVGVTSALTAGDTVASNHRGHGHALSKGVDLESFFLEIMGREGGACGGRGGSMHVADMSVGMLGANGIVGAGIPLAVGSALAHQVRGSENVAVVFFGDGAMAEGVLHESLNLASLWTLPVLFVCENNGWSEFSPASFQFVAQIRNLAAAFKIPSAHVDGNDILDVADAAETLVAAARRGGGPQVLECTTERVRGHYEGDPQKYRSEAELGSLGRNDPIARCEARLYEMKVYADDLAAIRERVRGRVSAAVEAGRAGAPSAFERVMADVYTPRTEA